MALWTSLLAEIIRECHVSVGITLGYNVHKRHFCLCMWIEFTWLMTIYTRAFLRGTCIALVWQASRPKLCVATGFRRIVSNVEPISYFSYHRISDFSLCSFVLRVYLSQTVDWIDLNFFFGGGRSGSYCWPGSQCFRRSTQLSPLSQGYLVGKGSISIGPLGKLPRNPSKWPNFCPPLGVKNLKGFQFQGDFIRWLSDQVLCPWTPLTAEPQTLGLVPLPEASSSPTSLSCHQKYI